MIETSVAGQVAVITGASQGIGAAIAQRLAHDGMSVVLADLQGDLAETVAAGIRSGGGQAAALTVDVTSAADRQRLFESALTTFGRLDVLVNSAAILRASMPFDVTEEHWDAVMNVNAKAVYFCCQEALRHMTRQRSGRVVNISSLGGKVASTVYLPVYNASKAAVIAMTRTLAMAGAEAGVRVNAVCPGIVATPMQDVVDQEIGALTGQETGQIRAGRLERIPLGQLGQPEEVADVVSFLVGPDSRYITGVALDITGGILT
jgi:NAD(P)-dependent dehydrogenase (short-subunit alcohol dehydrogenase family)